MGNWHLASKRLSVVTADFCLLGKVKDALTLNTSGNLILHRTCVVVPKIVQRHVVALAHEVNQGLVKTKSLLLENF